mmetsp:Transcript_8849/g.15011  ORF Transcript_8849/g.15011 Transcript_8849/m.15011 type:complete len:114 (+) Transcript_8849:613-954(+)
MDPDVRDDYDTTPLQIACSTGGERSVDVMMEHGASINLQDMHGFTALFQCFFRGTVECLKRLLPYKPNTGVKQKSGILPIESIFRDDMHNILDYVIRCQQDQLQSPSPQDLVA